MLVPENTYLKAVGEIKSNIANASLARSAVHARPIGDTGTYYPKRPSKFIDKGIVKWYDFTNEFGYIMAKGLEDDIFFMRDDLSTELREPGACMRNTSVTF